MTDAISRSAVLENIYEMDISDCTDVEDVIDKAYATIADAPGLDVAPVVHARWIDLRESYSDIPTGRCSNCGVEVYGVDGDVNYCFNCGARMDGEIQ